METVETATTMRAVIKRAVEYLQRKIRIQQVIVFGSHVTGGADKWSDIDLAVVSPDFTQMNQKQIMDLLVEVALAVDTSLEIRPYTPQDLQEARPTNFLGHILTQGKIVYKDGKFFGQSE
jgi:predicted nucleotidyltransferase